MSGSHFNRVLCNFEQELERPEYALQVQKLHDLAQRFQEQGMPLRVDRFRDWEHAQVLLALEQLAPRAARLAEPVRVLDVGGGNAPLAYLLAERGFQVSVMDIDRESVELTKRHAARLGLSDKLSAQVSASPNWPQADGSLHIVLSISVIEGVLRSRRPAFFSEAKRVLAPGGSLLLTFDYGLGARLVSDPPVSPQEVEQELITGSGLELIGAPFEVPDWQAQLGPPVKNEVTSLDGQGTTLAEYSFGALHLGKP
jgi:ubiquinone/menaquinone biosynthesis C-methylase UbiE